MPLYTLIQEFLKKQRGQTINVCSTLEPEDVFIRLSSLVIPAGMCISFVLSLA